MADVASIGFTCSSDQSESYKEKDVPLSTKCNLVGMRTVNVNKSFSFKIQIPLKAVVTLVKADSGHWHMADESGNYDPKWYLNESLALENVKLMQGLVVRGTLRDTNYSNNKKYCKQLDTNRDKFFTKAGLPVMTAKVLFIEGGRSSIWGRSVK